METSELRLKSCHGEIITCSVKEVIKHESGRIEYRMDNKKCNDFHNSHFDDEADDCRVRLVEIFASGNYHVFASYKNRKGNYRQGSQAIDADLLKNESI